MTQDSEALSDDTGDMRPHDKICVDEHAKIPDGTMCCEKQRTVGEGFQVETARLHTLITHICVGNGLGAEKSFGRYQVWNSMGE